MLSARLMNCSLYTALAVCAVWFGIEAVRLEAGKGSQLIGAGYFPGVIAIALLGTCLVGLVTELRKGSKAKMALPSLRRLVLVCLITAAYVAVWTALGWFYLATPVYLFLLFRVCAVGKSNPLIHAGAALAATAGMYLIFNLLLGVSL